MRRYPESMVWMAAGMAAVFGLVLVPAMGLAQSNFGSGYPDHQCGERPVPPERPEKFRDRAELDAYNEKVHAFNAAMDAYVECIQTYVDDAAADIRAIREKINAAIRSVQP